MRMLLVTLVALSVTFAWLLSFAYRPDALGTTVELSTISRLARAGYISRATLLDQDAQVVALRCVGNPPTAPGAPGAGSCGGPTTTIHAAYPKSDVATQVLIDSLSNSGAAVVIDTQTTKAMGKLVATFVLPLLILANLFGLIFLSKSGDSSIADIAGFGRIGRGRQRKRHSETAVTFADVAGASEAVNELREVTDYLTDPKRFEAYGASPPKGVMLFGSPGCGKTLLARAVAGESAVPFFSISGAEFVESLVGVGAARVRDLFAQVRAEAPAIVFIDEIDAVGRRRTGEGSSGGEREQTVNQLLVEMDGFEVTSGVVVIAATNRPDILDPALLRPGRFDRHITVEPPDAEGRLAILSLHAKGRPLAPDVDLDDLARATAGFTGADLANVINEGALLALRSGPETLMGPSHLSEAVLRVVHGPQRRGRILSAEERTRLAYHESGHAVVAAGLGRREDVARLSIVARGRGLAQTSVRAEERELVATSDLAAKLSIALAGVAAEEVVFGEASTAAASDLAQATAIAKDMVGTYGMSDQVGRRRLLSSDEGYLGSEAALDSVSGALLQSFDDEVKQLLEAAEATAMGVLAAHSEELAALASALEDHETLEGPALAALLATISPLGTPSREGQRRKRAVSSR